ncbi:MAG: NADAR family protein [Epsilonproteobacteria bacterium]|nr:NADAR family protein [Campylobacterota bacterium]
MKYTLNWLIELEKEEHKRIKYLFFWGHQKTKNGELSSSCFSQWWDSPFNVDNVKYNSAEHWMMAQKALLFDDKETYEKIILARTPAQAKALGREVKNFNDLLWNEKRCDIVVQGNVEKFTQNEELKTFLLNTNDRILVEASPVDTIWGIGLTSDDKNVENPQKWRGLNLLGFALMEARDILQK